MEQPNKRISSLSDCQFSSLQSIAEGNAALPAQSLIRRLKLFIRRHITPKQDRELHMYVDKFIGFFYMFEDSKEQKNSLYCSDQKMIFKKGDLVRVRSKDEIKSTLNHLGQLKGCSFMDAMVPYCDTIQHVFKSMDRFVDERELKIKKCKGLILLEGVMCEGTTEFGRCDRSCLMFWREEWLEKIE